MLLVIFAITSAIFATSNVKLSVNVNVNSEFSTSVHSYSYLGMDQSNTYHVSFLVTDIVGHANITFNDGNSLSNNLTFSDNGLYRVSGFPVYPSNTIMSIYGQGTFKLNELDLFKTCSGGPC